MWRLSEEKHRTFYQQLQLQDLLLDLGSQALEELPHLPGCLAVQRKTPPARPPAGPTEPPGSGGRTPRAEQEAAAGDVQSGLELAGRPPADIAVEPGGSHADC